MYKITVPDKGISYYQENLSYVKYQAKNNLMLLCSKEEAQGIVSQDGSTIYKFNEDDQLKEDYAVCTVEEVRSEDVLNALHSVEMAMLAGLEG